MKKETIDYFNDSIWDIIKICQKLGFDIEGFNITTSKEKINFVLEGEFSVGGEKKEFLDLMKHAIIKGVIDEDTDKDTNKTKT